MYEGMVNLGLRQTVIGVRFVPNEAMVIQDKQLLDRVLANALASGLRVVLAVYPYPPRQIEAGLASPSLFASYVGVLASIGEGDAHLSSFELHDAGLDAFSRAVSEGAQFLGRAEASSQENGKSEDQTGIFHDDGSTVRRK